jgi:cell division protein FtsN
MKFERGGFVMGLVVGLLIGLAMALAVALYVTKAPVPFVNKVPPRTAEQDQAEAQRNRNWDPNAPLAGKPAQKVPAAAASASAGVAAASAPGTAATPGAPGTPTAAAPPPAPPARSTTVAGDPFVYFVQVGAYANPDEAEQQRARLALAGWSARITEREQHGRPVYRVRLGPIERREEAESQQAKLGEAGYDARLVRVEKTTL